MYWKNEEVREKTVAYCRKWNLLSSKENWDGWGIKSWDANTTRAIQKVHRLTHLATRYTHIIFCHFSKHSHLQLKCTWSSVSPKLWFRCRRIIVLGLPASHLSCNTNTNGEYAGWRSSSKPAFWMAASAWADVWAGVLSWLHTTSICFLNWKNSWKDTKFLTTRTLSLYLYSLGSASVA